MEPSEVIEYADGLVQSEKVRKPDLKRVSGEQVKSKRDFGVRS